MTDTDPDDLTKLATAVREARERSGWSASRLALEAGVQKSTITRLERCERRPGGEVIRAVARALDILVTELLISAKWVPEGELPAFTPYLRSKYGHLPPKATAELEAAFARIAKQHGTDPAGPAPGEDEQ